MVATFRHARALLFIAGVAAAAMADTAFAQLVIVAEDPTYGTPPERAGSDLELWGPAFSLAGGIIGHAYERQVDAVAANFRAALGVDVLDVARATLTAPGSLAASPTVTTIADLTDTAVLAAMAEQGAHEAFVARYLVVTNRLFWARLIVARVVTGADKPTVTHVATLYYQTGLAPEHQGSRKNGWSPAALERARAELKPAFTELSALWARIAADSAGGADPQAAWAALPEPLSGADSLEAARVVLDCPRNTLRGMP